MGKSIMISVKPRFCDLIAREKKKIEVRKTKPNTEIPFKCYIYCTRAKRSEKLYSNGTVIVKDTRKLLDPSIHYPGSKIFHRWNGVVIGEFICDGVDKWEYTTEWNSGVEIDDDEIVKTCLDRDGINKYSGGKPLYGWHISDLVIYDKPKDLSFFGLKRPPQSWCYEEEEKR